MQLQICLAPTSDLARNPAKMVYLKKNSNSEQSLWKKKCLLGKMFDMKQQGSVHKCAGLILGMHTEEQD